MDVVILAGGFGTRLRSFVSDVPKPMAPVAGKPFLEILLASLSNKGITRAVLSLGHMADVVAQHFGSKFQGIDLVYAIETQPLGTGGAIRVALKSCVQQVALVINGDTFLELDVSALETQWNQTGRPFIVGIEVDDTTRFGRLVLDGQRVVGFAEKKAGGSGVINSGHYLLPTDIFDGFDRPDPFSFEIDFLMPNVQNLDFEVFRTNGLFIDIGVPEDFLRAQTIFT